MGDEKDIQEIQEVTGDFLFARPSIWSGLARWLDLSGRFDFYNISPSGETADALALYSDWRTVGQLLRRTCRSFSKDTAAKQAELFHKAAWQSHDERNQRRSDKARISGSAQR